MLKKNSFFRLIAPLRDLDWQQGWIQSSLSVPFQDRHCQTVPGCTGPSIINAILSRNQLWTAPQVGQLHVWRFNSWKKPNLYFMKNTLWGRQTWSLDISSTSSMDRQEVREKPKQSHREALLRGVTSPPQLFQCKMGPENSPPFLSLQFWKGWRSRILPSSLFTA